LFGFNGKKKVGRRLVETTMWYNAVGCFVTLALSLLVAPLAAAAPPAGKVPTIGVLTLGTATGAIIRANLEAFTQGLRALGYIEGQNIAIEPRYAEGRPERLPALAAELASLHVDVFVVGINRLAEVVQQTTTKIPIVMINAEEPVHFGLVQSLARPGGNITGLAVSAGPDWFGKNLELLTAALPQDARIGVLFEATSAVNALWLHAMEEAARGLGVTLVPTSVRSAEDFEPALAVMQHGNARGFVVLAALALYPGNPQRINELAVRSGLAAMWPLRIGVEAGGLMSYGAPPLDRWRRAATYVDKPRQHLVYLSGYLSRPCSIGTSS